MFRATFAFTLIFLIITTVPAKDLSSAPSADQGIPRNDQNIHRITEDYVQTQLDWRSYYLNRMAVRRHDLPEEKASVLRAPVARTN